MEKGVLTCIESNLTKIESSEIVIINVRMYPGKC